MAEEETKKEVKPKTIIELLNTMISSNENVAKELIATKETLQEVLNKIAEKEWSPTIQVDISALQELKAEIEKTRKITYGKRS
jgi:hypothetical protein